MLSRLNILLLLVLLIHLYVPLCAEEKNQINSNASTGHFDFSNWDFANKPKIELSGKWEFYWKQLLEPKDFDKNPVMTGLLDFPLRWNNQTINSVELERDGYATYRTVVTLPVDNEVIIIKFSELPSSYKAFVNGRLAGEVGVVAKNKESFTPMGRDLYYSFTPTSKDVEIVLQTSNYAHREGGTWRPVKIYSVKEAESERKFYSYVDSLLIGCIFLMAFYHLALFLFRRKNKSTLYFALCCIFLGIRTLVTGESEFLQSIFPGMSYRTTKFFEYFGFYMLVPFNVAFVYALYPLDVKKWLLKFSCAFGFFASFLVLVTPVSFFTDTVEYYQVFTVFVEIVGVSMLIMAAVRKRDEIYILLSGLIIFVLASMVDIVKEGTKMFDGPDISQAGLLIYIFAQSVLLSKRFSKAFTQVEIDEMQIRKMHSELIEKEKARTLFFHNTSHELRTPLNGILGFIDLIKMGRYGEVSSKLKVQIDKIKNLSSGLLEQVNTILELAKNQKGELKLSNSLIRLQDICDYAQNLADGLTLKKSGLSYEIAKNWEENEEAEFISDKDKLYSIIRNVVGNAFKFKDADRENKVKISIAFRESELHFKVRDTGIGIPEDDLNRIFEQFEQVTKEANRGYEGTGLGLAMVKEYVALMKGHVEVKSNVGFGTTFEIIIPSNDKVDLSFEDTELITTDAMGDDEGTGDIKEDYSEDKAHKIKKERLQTDKEYTVLVVDDNEANLEVVSELLKEFGYLVHSENSGAGALRYVENETPDLILLDLMMPEVSGEDVLKQVRGNESTKDIPVILLTARASSEDKIIGLALGADDYLAKPIFNEELLIRVKNTIERIELVKSLENMLNERKMVQIGNLLKDISHEVKNIIAPMDEAVDLRKDKMKRMLSKFSHIDKGWDDVVDSFFKEKVTFTKQRNRRNDLSTHLGTKHNVHEFRSLVRMLSAFDVDEKKLNDVLVKLLNMGDETAIDVENLLSIFEFFNILSDNSNKAYSIFAAMLDYTREKNTKEDCSLYKILNTCIQLIEKRLVSKRIEVKIDFDETLKVRCNKGEVSQVIMNILLNSMDALNGRDSDKKELKISARVDDNKAFFTFKDNGPGIPESNLEKIFESSFSTKGDEGNGVGLYISRKLMKRNFGNIKAIKANDGACFELEFKAVR